MNRQAGRFAMVALSVVVAWPALGHAQDWPIHAWTAHVEAMQEQLKQYQAQADLMRAIDEVSGDSDDANARLRQAVHEALRKRDERNRKGQEKDNSSKVTEYQVGSDLSKIKLRASSNPLASDALWRQMSLNYHGLFEGALEWYGLGMVLCVLPKSLHADDFKCICFATELQGREKLHVLSEMLLRPESAEKQADLLKYVRVGMDCRCVWALGRWPQLLHGSGRCCWFVYGSCKVIVINDKVDNILRR